METPKKIKVALLGVGTVGTGVYKILTRQREEMVHKIGAELEIVKILVRDRKKERPGIPAELLTDCFADILDDPEIQIVIEVMGGMEPARTYILEAFRHGKHVVSANKDLIANDGKELFEAAQENHRDFLFEAAVAGGIPIIRPLKQCLAGNNLTEVMGIVNGTTNFILTKMTENGMDFGEALKMAQELGYAEADPTADVEGLDAGRKMAIMASIAFHTRITFSDVYTEGITKISADDIRYAKEMGCDIKLLGLAKNTPEGIEVRVHPMLIPSNHALASVRDSFNAVFVHGDAVGDTMFYGRGAGEMPTGSAVVGDVIDIARNIQYGCNGRIGCTCYKEIPVKKMEDTFNSYFLRIQVQNRPGVLANIAAVFGNNQVSIAQIVQKKAVKGRAELVVITDCVCEKNMRDSVMILEGMSIIQEISSIIRVYTEEE
ncbi:MAG: homoserine dehydrogenase [Lachnospiraceae bacterium]|nr:homoserine dehydrogenase [Robinsoniella sp.]MDY3767392.1 homoserine dehydrogenase [Lachnospiraceae bacterium]